MRKSKILIVDDHPALRHGIAQLVNNESDMVVCGEASNRLEALAAVEAECPDLIILDISLGVGAPSGIDLIGELRKVGGGTPVLILSMHDEGIYAERSIRAGASGYLMKQEPVKRMVLAIREVLTGKVHVSPKIQRLLGDGAVAEASAQKLENLSEREFEVFRLIGQGMRPALIAKTLGVGVKTIESHRLNIRRKLSLANADELVALAVAWPRQEERQCGGRDGYE